MVNFGYTGSLKTTIDGLIVGAKNRANHTGSQPTSSITGLDAALAAAGPRSDFAPADHGLISWSYDPSFLTAGSGLTSGQLNLVKLRVPLAATITNVVLSLSAAGSGLTAGQNFAGLYDANRNLLAVTADQSTAWASAGLKTMALATAQSVTAGNYFLGFWANGTTPPQVHRMSGGLPVLSVGLTTTTYRYGVSNTGLTTTAPNPATAQTAGSSAWWAAFS